MTLIVVVLVGAGVLFVASAIECIGLQDTFQKIISGKTIDWSGQTAQCSSTGNDPLAPQGPPSTPCNSANEGKPSADGKFVCHNGQWQQITTI